MPYHRCAHANDLCIWWRLILQADPGRMFSSSQQRRHVIRVVPLWMYLGASKLPQEGTSGPPANHTHLQSHLRTCFRPCFVQEPLAGCPQGGTSQHTCQQVKLRQRSLHPSGSPSDQSRQVEVTRRVEGYGLLQVFYWQVRRRKHLPIACTAL